MRSCAAIHAASEVRRKRPSTRKSKGVTCGASPADSEPPEIAQTKLQKAPPTHVLQYLLNCSLTISILYYHLSKANADIPLPQLDGQLCDLPVFVFLLEERVDELR